MVAARLLRGTAFLSTNIDFDSAAIAELAKFIKLNRIISLLFKYCITALRGPI